MQDGCPGNRPQNGASSIACFTLIRGLLFVLLWIFGYLWNFFYFRYTSSHTCWIRCLLRRIWSLRSWRLTSYKPCTGLLAPGFSRTDESSLIIMSSIWLPSQHKTVRQPWLKQVSALRSQVTALKSQHPWHLSKSPRPCIVVLPPCHSLIWIWHFTYLYPY